MRPRWKRQIVRGGAGYHDPRDVPAFMDDLNAIALAIGFSIALAITAYLATRRKLGPGGSRELERLKRSAGIDDGAPAASPFLRDWLPWLIAGGVGAGAFIVVVAITGVSKGFSVSDIPDLQAGFVEGCSRRCAAEGADASTCESSCRCAFDRLRQRHPSDEKFVAWFGDADRNQVGEEAATAHAACLHGLEAPEVR